jgi:hypothetical protein
MEVIDHQVNDAINDIHTSESSNSFCIRFRIRWTGQIHIKLKSISTLKTRPPSELALTTPMRYIVKDNNENKILVIILASMRMWKPTKSNTI